MKKILARLSIQQLESALSAKKRLAKVEPLKRKLAKLQKAADKIQAKIDRLLGKKSAGRRGRPRKAHRGRPPMKRGRKSERPAKSARKMSAAAQKRVSLAVSRAQKRRWAAFRKAQKTKVKSKGKLAKKAQATGPEDHSDRSLTASRYSDHPDQERDRPGIARVDVADRPNQRRA